MSHLTAIGWDINISKTLKLEYSMTNSTSKRHQITGAQLIKIGRELTDMDPKFMASKSCEQLALHLTTTLGFEISCSNLRYAADAHEIKLAVKGSHRVKVGNYHTSDRLRRLAGVVRDLFVQLGQPLPDELSKILRGEK
jgi:hypothetical protein